MFKLEFKTNNSAFEGEYRIPEILRILENLTHRLHNVDSGDLIDWKVYDINGNAIGNLYLEESE